MKPVIDRVHPSLPTGSQKIYRFDNGYGASVVRTPYSYGGDQGKWELAVIHFNSDDNDDFTLSYDTPITDDVLGYLSWNKVEKTLKKIEALKD